jgi:hypothetical protein
MSHSLSRILLTGMLITAGVVIAPTSASASPNDFLTKVWEVSIPGTAVGESSPLLVDLNSDGISDVVVGLHNGTVLALNGINGHELWRQQALDSTSCINSSASAADVDGDGLPEIFIGSGCAQNSGRGALLSFENDGTPRAGFPFVAEDFRAPSRFPGIHSSPAIADIDRDGIADVVFGSLGIKSIWAIDVNGNVKPGFPYYSDDTNFSTAAFADLNSDGTTDFVIGNDQTWGNRGGTIRGMTGDGNQFFELYLNEIARSAPAIGDVDGDGQPEIVVGTGNHWSNPANHSPYPATDSTKIYVLSADGSGRTKRVIETFGNTSPSVALTDFNGDGRLDIAVGTSTQNAKDGGYLLVFDGKSGDRLATTTAGGIQEDIIGGVSSADFDGDGKQDIVIPTGSGTYIRHGGDASLLAAVNVGLITSGSTPSIEDMDHNGKLDMITGGFRPPTTNPTAVIQRWETSSARGAVSAASWPTFHHDARRTGNTTPPPLTQAPVELCHPGDPQGYWMVAGDGGVFPFCAAAFYGSTGAIRLAAPIVTMAPTPTGKGYWLVASDGGVFPFGDAKFLGSTGGIRLNQPIITIVPTPSGNGYMLIAKDGGVFPFGDANFYGSTGAIHLNQPVITAAMTSTGKGYWLVASDGGIFPFGDAPFHGSTGAIKLNQPIVTALVTPTNGYALIASDGGFFPFSDSPFYGSTGGIRLNQPIVSAGFSPTTKGYWLFAADGGVFPFGDAEFKGSLGKLRLNAPVVAAGVP